MFILLQKIILLLRGLFLPFIFICKFFNKELEKRWEFESRNLKFASSMPFETESDFAFEVSSEGELEQVKTLAISLLKKGLKIEILYSSDALESKMQNLFKSYPDNLRIFRMPLLSYSWFPFIGGQNIKNFIKAKTLFFCRYDFFPELLVLRTQMKLILLTGTLMNKKDSLKSWYLRNLYESFDIIVAANDSDMSKFKALELKKTTLWAYDFRSLQIIERIENRNSLLMNRPFFPHFQNWLAKVEKENRIVFGSYWPSENLIFSSELKGKITSGEVRFVIAPHKLSEEFLGKVKESLSHLQMPVYLIGDNPPAGGWEGFFRDLERSPGIVVSSVPGVLCELYQEFGSAFVGGGHGRSIHSLLEPYWAGCKLFCGPKTHRSTEYEFVKEFSPQNLFVVKELSNFFNIYKDNLNIDADIKQRKTYALEMAEKANILMPELIGDTLA